MESEVPKRHNLRPTLSTNMVQHVLWWEMQSGQTFYLFFKIALFGHILPKKKNKLIRFLVHRNSSCSPFGLQLVRGPKTL